MADYLNKVYDLFILRKIYIHIEDKSAKHLS